MFEGLVRQLLLGYLGQYIKDIQKEQLKITLWNEEVLLENVELILEAFDYLQLPFALKQGHVGKLSIKIPWKKLGWDPIIIILEDVVICACRREDKEWSSDAIERREFAGKKAKLATAELAKLSRRVCDNQTGKSFISYITAKILDGIQVSIRNVHVQYRDILTASGGTLFGLKFSGLTIMRQNSSGVSSGKVRGGQVNKLIKVQGLGFYCSTFEGTFDLVSMDDAIRGNHQGSARCEDNKDAYMLAPFEVSVFLSVNRSGKLENDAPQYSMNVELTRLVISINEVQLQEILTIYDYFSTCQLREKYGRYRPWWSPLEKKLDGWQTSWWRYAQESVLSDVKKRLRKTSWKYLGDRLKCRRKYVNLYKTKLKCLQEDQVIDENVLSELEEMEKESDIDDILSYRSSAERELQDFLLNSFSSGGSNSSNPDKSLEDEQASGKARGWLNWLSRGMLGAGGTDDSSQFSGVISDDVIQDIYEATKFRPVTPLNGDAAATDKIYLSSAKLNIREISATLRSLKLGYAIACLVLEDISAECKIWDESATIIASLSSARILNPLDMQAVLFTRMVDFGKGVAEVQQPVLNMQVDALPPNADVSLSVKVIIQPMEIFCDLQFINSIMEFYYILEHVSFQYERILLCLNGIDDVKARLVSKTEFVLLNRKRMMWDVNFINIAIVIPWGNTDSKPHQMVFEAGEVSLLSIDGVSSLHSDMQNQSYINSKYINCSTSSDDLLDFELQDLYNNFKINIGYFEMKILMAYSFGPAPLLEKSSASLTLVSCIIPDEPMMKGLDVNIRVSSLLAHFSPSIYKAIMGLVTHINMMNCISDSASLKTVDSNNIKPNGQMTYHAFWFSIIANLESVSLQLDLENDKKNSYTLTIGLLMLSLWFDKKECPECWASTKALRIISYQGQVETLILSSSENLFTSESTEHSDITFRLGNQSGNFTDNSSFTDGCLLFQYQAYRNLRCICHKYKIWLNNVDIHCYPFIVGLLAGFCDKIFGYDKPVVGEENPIKDVKSFPLVPAFELQRFGFSNVSETGSPECVSIPLDSFPFVTIQNRGSLPSLESSSISAISEWRKEVNLRDWKSRSSSFIAEKELECIDATLKSASGVESLPPNWNENDIIKVDLSIGSIKVHFHDSSCILGTVSISVSESLFSICGDHFDILCSTDGLTLSCSWWSPMIHDFLWGPLLPDLSPILNIRVKKENAGLEKYRLCISFGIQHVACILSPDFLALLIGYFSLPEWKCGATEQSFSGNSEYVNSDDKVAIEYKFEILDSNLLIPASFDGFQFLKLDIQQLYCSFIQSSGRDAAMKDIPSECLVMTDKIADRNNCLNLIGRDLSLSLLLPRDDVLQSSSLNQVSGWRNFTLIAPFGADVWVRIPRQCETAGVGSSYPTCVMAAATNCRVNAEGACVIFGYEALENVINEFSLIDEKSHAFTGDSVLFLQLMRGLVENAASSPEASSVTSIEIRFCVRLMTIRLQQSVKDSMTSEVIADAEMQFACSASLVNDKPVFLDISFSSLTLFSLLNSVMLAECTTTCSSSSALRVTLSVSEQGENKFHMCLPSLDIWLHRYDWSKVNDVFISYCGELSKNSVARHSSNSLIFNSKDLVQDLTVNVSQDSLQSPNASSSLRPENFQQDSSFYLLQLEKIGIKVHIPAQVNGDECGVFSKLNLNDSAIKTCGDQLGFVTFSVQTKPSELVIDGETMRMKINLEKARGTVELFGDTDEVTWPLFQLSQILLEGKIINYQMEHICVKCDTLDVWLSSHFVHLWCFMQFKVPESGPSHTPFSNVDLKVQLRKFTLLFTDGKWSPSGSLLEVVMRNIFFLSNMTDGEMDGSVEGDLQVNYNNIDKVLWEPFMEPWGMQLAIARRHDKSALLNSVITTNIQLKSKSQLNLNVTESLIEVVSRTIAMIEDSWSVMRMAIPSEGHGFPSYQINRNLHRGRDAPYIIQNLTSLPLVFHVCKGKPSSGDLDIDSLPSQDGNILQPGSSAPVYVDETPEEQLVRHRPSQSSDRLSDKHVLQAGHRYILIQFEGTSTPSGPVSMDLVGLRYFEVDFSKSSNKAEVDPVRDTVRSNKVEGDWSCGNSGFVVPVVIDVSVERHIKLIRLYSTVVLLNATPVPLEVRFDIPFGVSPKILDPVYPGHEFPLPLHLAEAGLMRWRPLGNTYLWSEAYSISKILSHENKISFSRSIVCYPSHPSSDPFRCCIWVNGDCLHSVGKRKKGLCLSKSHNKKEFTESSDHSFHNPDTSEQRFIYWVTLSCPLVLKNYLPEAVSLILENGSVTRNALLSEVETSFFHIDSSHDLTITLRMRGFKSSTLKFQRAETFCSTAKFDGSKLFLSETITFYPESFDGPLCVNVDKIMDGFSGAREVCISVPFLLCNCTGFPLVISNSLNDIKGHGITIPSCYDLDADYSLGRKDGLAILSSNQDLHTAADADKFMMASSKSHITTKSNEYKSLNKPLNSIRSSTFLQQSSQNYDPNALKVSVSTFNNEVTVSSQSNLKSTAFVERDNEKIGACMYSPDANSSPDELMVRVSRYFSGCITGNVGNGPWSSPFPLVPPTGSITVLVPQPPLNTSHVVSVSAVAAPFSGRTRIITFQPRYVISNACNKALYYKQKGTDFVFLLDAGQHANIQWTDTTRDLLVSVRFDEPGWQWSGCFLPEHLGDTQVKIHNYLSGVVIMMRVEVQTADLSIKDEKVVGSPRGNSGTHIILVSVDDTGFMPYRIDNFSKERLRIYQQKCETFETLVNSYASCPYAWDEPCYPHRLTVEVTGVRVIGSYALDDAKDFSPVYLPASSEKPERTLFVSVHSEGAIKVLSIIDSTYHNLSDLKSPDVPQLNYKRNHAQKHEIFDHYTERIAIEIPFIGISLMNSFPKELLFACAKGVAVDLMQSLDQQKFALQISSLQIDNQLYNTPYPVILSFDCDNKGHTVNQIKMIDDPTKITGGIASDKSIEPVFSLAVAKWRNKDITVVSFEYISLRVADFHLELEQEIVLSLVDFLRAISSRLESRVLHHMGSTLHPFFPDLKAVSNTSAVTQANKFVNLKGKLHFSDERAVHEDQKRDLSLGQVIPIGAPWQQIHLLARQQKKIYVELLDLAPVKLSLSFSSSPWTHQDGVLVSGESLIHRGLVALADIEGAKIHLKQLSLSHQLASWESIQEILIRHYTRQFIHDIYKLFGSAGVLGNPMGFARTVGLGIKDFLSVPIRSVFQSPAGLITGMAQGTTSLLSNTVYAISDAATQFSKVTHKGIVAFTFDDQIVAKMEMQQKGMTSSHNKGLINGFFEGLTGLLQSPIKGAEKHGIPGVLSGIALGVTGLVARPAASILEVTGKTAQSIRNRSRVHRMGSQRLRVRLPRPLSKESVLKPYSWEEAVGTSVLAEADDGMKLRDEILMMCKRLKQGGKYVIITERLILVVSCSSLGDLGKSTFQGIPAEPEWVIETDIGLDSIIHADNNEEVVHIVGSSSDPLLRQNQNQHIRVVAGNRGKLWNQSPTPSPLPLFHVNLEFMCNNDAENFLRVLLSTIEKGKDQGWGCVHLLHQSNLK